MATIPFADPYVDAVLPPDVLRVGPSGEVSPWLDHAYLAAHAAEIDVLHLHTGPASSTAAAVECWAETVRRLGVPLVVTVHGLGARAGDGGCPGNPAMDAHLEAVLSTAEVVFTLTPGAADEIAERYGRTAIVVAHPAVAAPDPDVGAERGLVGLRLGRVSAAVPDPGALVRATLSGAVSGGGRLRVLVDAADEPWAGSEARKLAARGELELLVHPSSEWPAQLQQLHVAVLPEPCGHHSRDLEICRDVGTRVVAPGCGWFADQWSDVVSYGSHEQGRLDPVSLAAAIGAALIRPMPRPADCDWREEQRAAVRQVHADVYAQVAGDRSWV
ncbi:glycosyl transferase family 4 [Blastococcus colisei]|uniref:Glycosyl transferase family 4 n=1 Tax=Blastococcus colisei TaxID=1564162 RepID=A0A543PAM2_9ACTN|nr:glycosyltransferase family 4 protein [Blastococcus colisei]TQN41127.1 glycosyl transferase family 4 [Blastococcus colisei]